MFTKLTTVITVFILMLASVPIAAELAGTVYDLETGESIPGATVKIADTNFGQPTDNNGNFKFENAPSGKLTIIASIIGYQIGHKTVQADQADEIKFYLEPKILKGQDIIVTGTRAKLGETPATFSNYSRDDIEANYWMQDTPMLLANMPNIFAYSDAGNGIGYSYLKLRGFNQNRVAVMINGIPLNGAESHEVYWVDLPDFAGSIQDIQVQRGVGSSLYGQSAFGGSINMITNDFSPLPSIKTESGYGSYNTKKFSITGNSGLINDSYVFHGRYSKMETDGYRNNAWVDMYSYFIGVARYDENMTWKFNAYGGPEELHLAYKGITQEQLEVNRKYNEMEYDQEIDHFNQPHYEFFHDWNLSDGIELSNTLYYFQGEGFYNQYRENRDLAEHNLGAFWDFNSWIMYTDSGTRFPASYYANLDNDGNPLPDSTGNYPLAITTTDLVRKPIVKERDWGWIPRITFDHNKGKMTLGAEVRIHSSRHYGEILWAETYPSDTAPNSLYHDYEGHSNTLTLFANESYDLLEKLTLMTTLQYQRHNYKLDNDKRYKVTFDRDFDFFSPRFGAIYKLDDLSNVYFSLSTASRQPTFQDIYNPQDYWSNPTYRPVNFVPNGSEFDYVGKELVPEKLFDIELGSNISQSYGDLLVKGDLCFYRMQIKDELVPYAGQIDDMNLPLAGNAEETLHQGIELSLTSQYQNLLSAGFNISMNDDHFVKYQEFGWDGNPIDLSGNRIGGFPEMLANYNFRINKNNIGLGFNGTYRGKQFIENAEKHEIDSYNIVNAFISYSLLNFAEIKSIKLTLRIQNLFDKEYIQAGYADWDDGDPRYIVAAKRNLYVSLATEF